MREHCRTIDFHFNKGNLQDPTIPMWVVKTKGKSFYVDHVESNATWSTRETPEGYTKGSLRFKNCFLKIEDNVATISQTDYEGEENG
jgi:hypothetical protein